MIERSPLRREVQKEVLARIADHRLPAGARINESRLSADVGVSRTPLREAMLGLEALGFLESDLGRGFMVPLLSRDKFMQGQAMLAKMAPHALVISLKLPGGRVMELSNLLGRSRISATQPGGDRGSAVANLICRWSALLTAACPNQMLAADIGRLEALARRYWNEAVILDFDPGDLLSSYGELYELLRAGHLDESAVHWENHITRFSAEAARFLPDQPLLA